MQVNELTKYERNSTTNRLFAIEYGQFAAELGERKNNMNYSLKWNELLIDSVSMTHD